MTMKIKTLLTNIKACIFDMDGTLVDSLGIWDDIDVRFFKEHHLPVPENYDKTIAHMSFMEMAQYTKEEFHLPESKEEIANTWLDWSKDAYVHTILAKEGAHELLSYLKDRHIPLSLATTNKKELYEPCLKRNHLDTYFDFICNVNDLHTTKSRPDIYLYLADKMHSKPCETMVFEDILMAVNTAKKASFKVTGVYDKRNKEDLPRIKETTDFFLNSFTEIEYDK